MWRCEDEQMWRWADVKMSRCEDEQMWRWADVKMSRCEDEKMWRWAGVKMSRCEDEQMWRLADVKMSRCEEQMWRWAEVKMSRCEDEQVWRWADVKMSRCEDEQMWRWADVKMSRCEDEQVWRWEDVKMSRCDEQMWRWEDVKMRRCEDEKVWRWEGVKMRRCEDEKVWRWEDEIQTPTIRRTLRSDALGKNAKNSYMNHWLTNWGDPPNGFKRLFRFDGKNCPNWVSHLFRDLLCHDLLGTSPFGKVCAAGCKGKWTWSNVLGIGQTWNTHLSTKGKVIMFGNWPCIYRVPCLAFALFPSMFGSGWGERSLGNNACWNGTTFAGKRNVWVRTLGCTRFSDAMFASINPKRYNMHEFLWDLQ